MKTLDLNEILNTHPYPGRGIVLGRSADDKKAVIVYFIMGRSENSRNRIFEATEDGIRTKAFDESKMTDPSLIIYHPVRMVGTTTIVTNGDQTDTIRDALLEGRSYVDALRTRTYEPDEPNYTPRISGVVNRDGKACVTVRNVGETIPPEELPLLFERFHKSDKSRSEDQDGYGLGLYIVKTILEQHKEKISVTSEDGVTTFSFSLATE